MAKVRKLKTGRWLAEVRRGGFYRSKTCDSKLEAERWRLETEQAVGINHHLGERRTLADAIERYEREISPHKKGARWERVRLKRFLREPVAGCMLADLRTHDIQQHVLLAQARGLAAGSINRDLTLLSAVLKHCRNPWRWMEHNPMTDVRRPKEAPPRDRRISANEIDLVLAAIGYNESAPPNGIRQELGIAFLLALETAMRQGEIYGLRKQHVNLQGRFVHLPETKNGSSRDVALSRRACALLAPLVAQRQDRLFISSQASAGTVFRRAVRLAGIENLRFHDARHEAITRLAQKLKMLDLARMVGHKDPRSLMIYYNPTASEIAAQLD